MNRFVPIDELPDDAPDFIKAAQRTVAAAPVDYVPTLEMLEPYRRALLDAYIIYCQTVSKRSMAISIETAAYIAYLADHLNPVACDLGSGFTSFALRKFAKNVTSVDDNAEWLRRSKRFSRSYRVDTDNFVLWDDLDKTSRFGLLVNDFSSGEIRNASFPVSFAMCSGPIVCDDAGSIHHDPIRQAAVDAGRALVDISVQTVDIIGRYAVLIL